VRTCAGGGGGGGGGVSSLNGAPLLSLSDRSPFPSIPFANPPNQMTERVLEQRMVLLERLLPGVDAKLPSMVLRRPLLLLRSPRALTRDIRQLGITLSLTDWAAARLVAGGPAILEHSLITLARRCVLWLLYASWQVEAAFDTICTYGPTI